MNQPRTQYTLQSREQIHKDNIQINSNIADILTMDEDINVETKNLELKVNLDEKETLKLIFMIQKGEEAKKNNRNGGRSSELDKQIKLGKLAGETLIFANKGLIVSIARILKGQNNIEEDLLQEGSLGLLKAAKRFDSTRGVIFSTYAGWRIRQYMAYHLRLDNPIIMKPNIVRRSRVVEQVMKDLDIQLNKVNEEKINIIAEATGFKTPEIKTIIDVLSMDKPLSFDREDEKGESSLTTVIGCSKKGPEDITIEKNINNIVRNVIIKSFLNAPKISRKKQGIIFALRNGILGIREEIATELAQLSISGEFITIKETLKRTIKTYDKNKEEIIESLNEIMNEGKISQTRKKELQDINENLWDNIDDYLLENSKGSLILFILLSLHTQKTPTEQKNLKTDIKNAFYGKDKKVLQFIPYAKNLLNLYKKERLGIKVEKKDYRQLFIDFMSENACYRLGEIGLMFNLTRERIRQIEETAKTSFKLAFINR